MSLTALGLVLFAAVLHASWNALVKAGNDRAAVLAAVSGAHAVAGLVLLAFVPWPAAASWPSIAISTVIHFAYYVLMFQAYRHGDLSQVYPISRGLAPALVALSAYLFLGENLSPGGWAGLAAISFGIFLLAAQRDVLRQSARSVGLSVLLGISIATYSVADGIGVRLAESPLGYMGWLFLLEAPVPAAIAWHRWRSGRSFQPKVLAVGFAGGLLAVMAYGTVLYVKTFTPLGAVSAVRESSVLIAALIGVVFLGERPWQRRLLSALVVAAGVILLTTSNH